MKTPKKIRVNLDDIYKHRLFHIVLLVCCVIFIIYSVVILLDLNNYYVYVEDADNTYVMEQYFNEQEEMIVKVTFKKPQFRLRYIGLLDAPRIYEQYYTNGYSYLPVTVRNVVYKGKKIIDEFDGEEIVKEYNLGNVENNTLKIERETYNYKISYPLKTWFPYAFLIVFSSVFMGFSLYSLYLIRRAEG